MIVWRDEIDHTNTLPDLTEEILRDVESRLGVKLPESYIELIRTQNGGFIEQCELPVTLNGLDDTIVIDSIMGVSLYEGLVESKILLKEWGVEDERLIAFAGDGHYFLMFDYRDEAVPKIALLDTTAEKIDVRFDSFEQFTEALRVIETDAFVGVIEGETLLDYAQNLLYSEATSEKTFGANIWLNSLDVLDVNELVMTLLTWMDDDTLRETAISTIQSTIISRRLRQKELIEAFFRSLLEREDAYSKQCYEETINILENGIEPD
ncbi:SMI1/KNR4 family protein [Exiguobacterium qingdaonense]|uniref:SMI1/KNR4 family protein n=1 Tax=Exiguobacterium qingdaonense TaxID=2751251 RepID=UPI001BEB6F5D